MQAFAPSESIGRRGYIARRARVAFACAPRHAPPDRRLRAAASLRKPYTALRKKTDRAHSRKKRSFVFRAIAGPDSRLYNAPAKQRNLVGYYMTRPAALPLLIGAPQPADNVVEIAIRMSAAPGTGVGETGRKTSGAETAAPGYLTLQ